jgi:TRAP transporter TAXI family solute receptor
MARLLMLVIAFAAALAGGPANAADPFEKNIMTGGPKGTYIQIGRNIAALGEACGLKLNVVESAGSLENFIGVRQRRNTQFGIVQSDVLEYLKTYEANDPEIQEAVRGVRIMFPLYNEEVHLVARKEIASADDLAGKKVVIGEKDSGTFLTASLILDILRVEKAERIAASPADGLEKLLAGEVDAFFFVAGAPASLLVNDRLDPEKYHLVKLDDAALRQTYTPASIAAGTYPFVKEETALVAVKAVLMTYDYDRKRNAYHRQSCKAVADFSNLIITNLDELKETGHPKWKTVDLTALPPGWQVGVCVKEGMALDYRTGCEAAPAPAANGDSEYLDLLKQRLKSGSN